MNNSTQWARWCSVALVGMTLIGCGDQRAESDSPTAIEVSASDECAQLQAFFSELISLTNKARQDAGVGELSFSYQLGQAAQGYAEDLATQNFFGHTGKDGSTLVSRIEATGYELAAAGENLAAGQSTASSVFQEWMNSPGHRANILQADFTEVGFGLFDGTGRSDYGHYWVQNFGKPQSGHSHAEVYIPSRCGLSVASSQETAEPTVAGIAVRRSDGVKIGDRALSSDVENNQSDLAPLFGVLSGVLPTEALASGVAGLVGQADAQAESVSQPAAIAGLSVLGIALWRNRRR